MAELTEAGCVGFSQADVPLADTLVLLRALQYAATFGYTRLAAPAGRAPGARRRRARAARWRRGSGLSGVPVAAETIALHTIFELVREHRRARAPVPAVVSAAGVDAGARAPRPKGCR